MSKADEMQKIQEEVQSLVTSPLYTYRTENGYLPVVGEGSIDAHIMFVGEAPGKNEAKTGRPFCGAAGKILDELLVDIGIKREDVYITNIVKDRPPKNRDPLPEELAVYGIFLDRQIGLLKPKVIVTLGRHAMEYIMKKYGLGLETIGEAHGKEYKVATQYGQASVVALYHPCVALYNRSKLSLLKNDIKILKKYTV
jgi:DNA polymerase